MSENTVVTELLETALQQAADVARTRLERDVQVVAAQVTGSTAILRFDLSFGTVGRLAWFVSNEDATGFSDLLIGGAGDRGAVLTEMHLDALTAAFSDMLERAVNGIGAGLDAPLEQGELDLGMEPELPALEPGGASVTLALEIADFGSFTVIQHANAALAAHLERHAVPAYARAQAPAAAPEGEVVADAPVATAAPAAQAADNVVSLPNVVQPAQAPGRSTGDLDMLMNVPLPLTVELGNTQRTIRELVEFTVGSIIELGKLAGDPLDIKVNDRVIARGEVVVIDEEFGIRITEIMSAEDRLRGLG
ncbi:MAG: flagellar motor switch protein FliN [Thermoleophilia bacterium]|nr:flagellar motor switch protein FliN [Thermoleophilia bacterium]